MHKQLVVRVSNNLAFYREPLLKAVQVELAIETVARTDSLTKVS